MLFVPRCRRDERCTRRGNHSSYYYFHSRVMNLPSNIYYPEQQYSYVCGGDRWYRWIKLKKKEERKKRKKYRIELADYRKAICLFAHPERIDESCSNGKWRERISRRVFESSNNADVSSISAPGGTIRLSRVSLEERFLEKVRMRTCKVSVKVTVRVEYSKNLIIAIGSPISSKKNPIENIESSE